MQLHAMNKKGDALLVIVFLIVLITLALMIFDVVRSYGCSSDDECSEGSYCGVDRKCHEFPEFENATVKEQVSYDLIGPSVVIGISIIIAAYLLRNKKWR